MRWKFSHVGTFNWSSTSKVQYTQARHRHHSNYAWQAGAISLANECCLSVHAYLAGKIPTLVLFYNVKQNKTKCSSPNFSFLCLLVILRRKIKLYCFRNVEVMVFCWRELKHFPILGFLRYKEIIIPLEYSIHIS